MIHEIYYKLCAISHQVGDHHIPTYVDTVPVSTNKPSRRNSSRTEQSLSHQISAAHIELAQTATIHTDEMQQRAKHAAQEAAHSPHHKESHKEHLERERQASVSAHESAESHKPHRHHSAAASSDGEHSPHSPHRHHSHSAAESHKTHSTHDATPHSRHGSAAAAESHKTPHSRHGSAAAGAESHKEHHHKRDHHDDIRHGHNSMLDISDQALQAQAIFNSLTDGTGNLTHKPHDSGIRKSRHSIVDVVLNA